MKYLLDTCTLSNFVKGHAGILQRLKATSPDWIFLSSLTVMEIEYGLKLNPARALKVNGVLESVMSSVTVLPFDEEDATLAGSLRAVLRLAGTPVGAYDLLIASQALKRGLVLVTQNTREFSHIPGLILDDWQS